MNCFVIAMFKEAEPILKHARIESDETICGKRVIRGELFKKNVGIVICGVGKANAACGTQLAIDRFHPDTVVNVGMAGGLNGSVSVGQIYAVAEAVQYDFDLSQINGTAIGTLDECKENYLPLSVPYPYPSRRLATGDRFNDSEADYRLLTRILNADIRDMEGGAIAQVCMHAGVKCVELKIISDLAGSGSTTEQYLHNLSVCARTLDRETENIVKGIS